MAHVTFNETNWDQFVNRNAREHLRQQAYALWNMMDEARPQNVPRLMELANRLLDAHGVERIPDPADTIGNIANYVNFGDTYAETLLYDVDQHAFYLTSYGDWLEFWEEAHPQEIPCERCGRMTANFDADTGFCDECRTRVAFWDWSDSGKPPLIAMLQSTGKPPVAVHLWSAREDPKVSSGSRVDLLAFSIPMPIPGVFSAKQIVGRHRGPDVPYIYTWAELAEEFSKRDTADVAFAAEPITIDREQFERLRIAWDAFLEGGYVQTVKEFLTS